MTALDQLHAMNQRLDEARALLGPVVITADGQPLPPQQPLLGTWQPVLGFTDADHEPNFWTRAVHFDIAGSSYVRSRGRAGAGGGRAYSVPQATRFFVLRGALLWTAAGQEPRRVEAGEVIHTPAGATHRWLMLEDCEGLVEFSPPL